MTNHIDFDKEYNELVEKLKEIRRKKGADYGDIKKDNPFANLKEVESLGISAFIGILIRLCDKFGRLKSFAKKGSLQVKDETIEDTLLDIANYSLLAILLHKEEIKNKNRNTERGIICNMEGRV